MSDSVLIDRSEAVPPEMAGAVEGELSWGQVLVDEAWKGKPLVAEAICIRVADLLDEKFQSRELPRGELQAVARDLLDLMGLPHDASELSR